MRKRATSACIPTPAALPHQRLTQRKSRRERGHEKPRLARRQLDKPKPLSGRARQSYVPTLTLLDRRRNSGFSLARQEEVIWRITVSESNPYDKGRAPPGLRGVIYAMGTTDFLVRPPLVPRGAAAFASRAERAATFIRRLLEAATDHIGGAAVAMPVHASARGS